MTQTDTVLEMIRLIPHPGQKRPYGGQGPWSLAKTIMKETSRLKMHIVQALSNEVVKHEWYHRYMSDLETNVDSALSKLYLAITDAPKPKGENPGETRVMTRTGLFLPTLGRSIPNIPPDVYDRLVPGQKIRAKVFLEALSDALQLIDLAQSNVVFLSPYKISRYMRRINIKEAELLSLDRYLNVIVKIIEAGQEIFHDMSRRMQEAQRVIYMDDQELQRRAAEIVASVLPSQEGQQGQ